MGGHVVTVKGLIDPAGLGITLVHEHLHADLTPLLDVHGYGAAGDDPFEPADAAEARWSPGSFRDNYRLDDIDLVATELAWFRQAGGAAVVDVTPSHLGRDPRALVRISGMTGLHVVMGAGYYLASSHPAELRDRSTAEIAEALVAEFEVGVDGTGCRPGIIGELGTSDPPHNHELTVLRAAAAAQEGTGLPISVHLHPWSTHGDQVLDTLTAGGADPLRVLLGHMSTAIADDAYQVRLLEQGANLGYDLFGFDHSLLGVGRYPPSDHDVARKVVDLYDRGYGDQLFVSQDIGVRTRLRAFGGWGYAHLLDHVVPLLTSFGLGEADVRRLLVENPRRLLTVPDQREQA